MNRYNQLALGILFALCANGLVVADYSGGTGTAETPFRIASPQDWLTLTDTPPDWDKYFVLESDIDLYGLSLLPVGNEQIRFNGVFDGNGYMVTNATLDTPAQSNIGLFGYVGARGIIINLGLTNVFVHGDSSVGALVGASHGLIMDCFAYGEVVANGWDAGGLVGSNIAGTVARSYAACRVTSSSSYVGGLVGFNFYDTIVASYATGQVNGASHVGGLVGSNDKAFIADSYATGRTTAAAAAGGLVGHLFEGDVAASFWDIQTTGQANSAAGEGQTTAEMTTASLYIEAGWDLQTEWWIPDESYPRLLGLLGHTLPLPGDLNRDHTVDIRDMLLFVDQWLRDDCKEPDWCGGADFNRSGTVNLDEWTLLSAHWNTTYTVPLPGDLDRNLHIDLADVALLSSQWQRNDCIPPDWCDGADINRSGSVDTEDVLLITERWLTGAIH